MNGLELAREFFGVCLPLLRESVPDIMDRAAVGLVGEGSECFGCDDEYSRDHDYGPAFCLWLPREELRNDLPRLEAALERLPREFSGMESRLLPERRMGRVGPLPLEDFYAFFTGLAQTPSTWQEWLRIPEYQLAACTNGAVFADGLGEFTRRREALLAFYPRDVFLKKLAARCMVMAQAGQYNLPRCLARGDSVAAMLAVARFGEAALSFVYLCNRRYMPFYKWAGKLARQLPVLGPSISTLLDLLAITPLDGEHGKVAVDSIESFCASVASHLRAVGLSDVYDTWLWAHGPSIMTQVRDPEVRKLDLLQG
ncbi:MAG: DUF4037 domain-containing protein [Desulfovibrio sp.]|nr:DUF4037 domain-containing protein [Desulfovibrio sp.]